MKLLMGIGSMEADLFSVQCGCSSELDLLVVIHHGSPGHLPPVEPPLVHLETSDRPDFRLLSASRRLDARPD